MKNYNQSYKMTWLCLALILIAPVAFSSSKIPAQKSSSLIIAKDVVDGDPKPSDPKPCPPVVCMPTNLPFLANI
jgi:hypothetical protein